MSWPNYGNITLWIPRHGPEGHDPYNIWNYNSYSTDAISPAGTRIRSLWGHCKLDTLARTWTHRREPSDRTTAAALTQLNATPHSLKGRTSSPTNPRSTYTGIKYTKTTGPSRTQTVEHDPGTANKNVAPPDIAHLTIRRRRTRGYAK